MGHIIFGVVMVLLTGVFLWFVLKKGGWPCPICGCWEMTRFRNLDAGTRGRNRSLKRRCNCPSEDGTPTGKGILPA